MDMAKIDPLQAARQVMALWAHDYARRYETTARNLFDTAREAQNDYDRIVRPDLDRDTAAAVFLLRELHAEVNPTTPVSTAGAYLAERAARQLEGRPMPAAREAVSR